MSQLKRTQLYDAHVRDGATMVDFGGWEMPMQYPTGIVAEHLYTRRVCSLFDVSHMGRFHISGPQRVAFLQRVITSNVAALEKGRAQYCIISDEDGSAIDDAFLYRFEDDSLLFVVNASNAEKDKAHLLGIIKDYDCTLTDISSEYAAIAVQGPKSEEMLEKLSGGKHITEKSRNSLNILSLEGHTVWAGRTGYTGEPVGFEIYLKSSDAMWLWDRLIGFGARPAGLGARDTLRMEACMPLYGHEMGLDADGNKMPVFAVPLAKFAVAFTDDKRELIGREALEKQSAAFKRYAEKDFSDTSALPRRIRPIALTDRGVIRAGMPVYAGDRHVGWVTSGTMIPCYTPKSDKPEDGLGDDTIKRSIGLCYIDADLPPQAGIEVDVRGKRLHAVIPERHMTVKGIDFVFPIIAK